MNIKFNQKELKNNKWQSTNILMSNFKAFESHCNCISFYITYIFITLLFFYFKYWLIEGKQRLIIVNVVIVIGGKTFNWKIANKA